MPQLRVQSFGLSIHGYGAGPHQDLQNPLGVGGPELMEWVFHTRLWREMHALGYECAKSVAGERATHIFLRKRT
jgi:hypothetical protein